MAVRYKKFGKQEYAYRIWNEKDPETKKWRQRSLYLGVVIDKEKGIYEKRNQVKRQVELAELQREGAVLDYGDSFFIHDIIANLPIVGILKKSFGDLFDTLMALVFHRITGGSAMRHAEYWYHGNYVSKLFPNAKMSSQDISRFLEKLGKDSVQKDFLEKYIPLAGKGETGCVIDSTGLPNEINMPTTSWGYADGGIEFETRLILAINRETERPLFFRYVAGNIGDVSTLKNTVAEMKKNGIQTSSVLIDAGYFSQSNLELLLREKINFLIRMPANRTIYKNIISENTDIESPKYATKYNKRGLFVKEVETEIYGHKAFAYLVLDPERRGREIAKTIAAMEDDGSDVSTTSFLNCGKMILLSSEKLPTNEVVPLYYTRQIVERMFGIAKDDLNILPLRTHSEPNFKGFMMLIFISLIISCEIKARLGKRTSIDLAVSILKNWRCHVFNNLVLPNEISKKQRSILEEAKVLVPNFAGV